MVDAIQNAFSRMAKELYQNIFARKTLILWSYLSNSCVALLSITFQKELFTIDCQSLVDKFTFLNLPQASFSFKHLDTCMPHPFL